MPTITLNIDVTQDQADKLQRWFPRWNEELKNKFNSIEDALIDHLRNQMEAFVKDQERKEAPMEQVVWDSLTDEQRKEFNKWLKEK